MDSFFFFNDTATTEIYTLSLHDALPIFRIRRLFFGGRRAGEDEVCRLGERRQQDPLDDEQRQRAFDADRKSTRLNSSHLVISYAVFCLKKKTLLSSCSHHTARCRCARAD